MKKRIVLIIFAIIIMVIFCYAFLENQVISKITLEINPSIEINLKRGNKVKSVVALNDDAKKVINDDMINKSLEEVLNKIVDNIYDLKMFDDSSALILMANDGNVDGDNVKNIIENRFRDKHIGADVLIIYNISKDDKSLAKKYNITPVKAAYVRMVASENEHLKIDTLVNSSINQLREMKDTGNYCDDGYILEHAACLKEIEQKVPTIGDVCPNGYLDYEGTCYLEVSSIDSDEYECYDDFKLTDDKKCVGVEKIDATGDFKCDVGELIKRENIRDRNTREAGNQNEYLCEDKSSAQYPKERCYLQEHAIINGKCAMGPKPLLPTATGCEGHDINYNGGCYDPAPNEPYICPNGERFDTNTELCIDTFKYTKAIGNYTCPERYKLDGTKCTRDSVKDASLKKICSDGYKLVYHDRCIDEKKKTNFVLGNICDMPNSRLSNGMCIIYEIISAKHK